MALDNAFHTSPEFQASRVADDVTCGGKKHYADNITCWTVCWSINFDQNLAITSAQICTKPKHLQVEHNYDFPQSKV